MTDLITKIEYCGECLGILLFSLVAGLLIRSLIYNHMFKKKYGPKRTQVLCPNTAKPLMDFELMYGHCAACKFHSICRDKITADVKKIKK